MNEIRKIVEEVYIKNGVKVSFYKMTEDMKRYRPLKKPVKQALFYPSSTKSRIATGNSSRLEKGEIPGKKDRIWRENE